ncbi:phage major capsid protein [Alsobacter sp. R-9]
MTDRLEFKAALHVNDAGEITGLAWPFGTADRVGDVITKGAFTGAPDRLPMLWSHDQAQVIGVWDSITETDEGLSVKGRLLLDVERAREVRTLVKEGAVSGLSIGFQTKTAAARKGGGRTISALDLVEVSVVAVPCHPGARITSAKAAGAADNMGSNLDIENKGAAPELAAIETKLADLAGEVKSVAAIGDRLDKIEARLNRPAASSEKPEGAEKKAFNIYVRRGVERASPDEVKALRVASDTAGGYLAPEEFGNEILKALVQYSPIRSYARVVATGASEIKYPKRTASTAATWVAETAARTSSEPAYDQMTITPFELATYVDVSTQLLEDNTYNLEGELAADLAEQFGKTEGAAFVNGTGTGQPVGLLTAAGITEVKTGNASSFAASNPADVLIKTFHALPQAFAQNGAWLMNRNTLSTVRQFKDGQGRYLLVDPLADGMPITLLGRPVVEAIDMPDVAANATPILFGDMSGYRIIDRVGLSVLRDPYSLATTGQVRFHARRRVGAAVTHPDRFVKIKVAA